MHPPEWVVKEIERVNPHARLAFGGEEKSHLDEMRTGTFVVLDLVPNHIAKRSLKEPWGHRGPIFGSKVDYERRTPLWIDNVTREEVFSGEVLLKIHRWTTPLRDRLTARHLHEQDRIKTSISEQAGEIGAELYWNAQRSTDGGVPNIANKFVTKQEWKKVSGDWKEDMPDTPIPDFPEHL